MSKGTQRYMHVPVMHRPREYETIEFEYEGVACVGIWDRGDISVRPLENPSARKWDRRALKEARRLFQQAHDIQARDEARARERSRATNNEYFSRPDVQARLQREHAERERARERQRVFEQKRQAQVA